MINKSYNPALFVNTVKTSGGSANLVPGELLVVDVQKPTGSGLGYASDLKKPRNEKFLRLDVGVAKRKDSRSRVVKNKRTEIFALEDIDSVSITYPEVSVAETDGWIVGYNGGNDVSTSLNFIEADKMFILSLEISGGSIPFSGGNTNTERIVIAERISELLPTNSCSTSDLCDPVPCKEVITKLVERLRRRQIGGGRKFEEIADITPIFSCDQEVGNVEYTTWTLKTCDLGDDSSLGLIQKGVATPVIRIARDGSTSTYQTMAPGTVSPANVVITPNSIMADCETCPASYTKEDGGFIYTYTKVDTGASAIVTIPAQVANTNIFQGTSNGFSTYTVKTTRLLTSSEISTLHTANPTMVIDLVGETSSICNPNSNITLSWVQGETCEATTRQFTIDVPDNVCGESRLVELQKSYPQYTITYDPASSMTTYTATLVGTSGSGNFVINGVNYLATFATSLANTASAFVTAHESAIEALGGEVSANSAVITFKIPSSLGAVTYTSVAGLTSTIVTGAITPSSKGCRNQYLVTVPTNITCEECDPVFRDIYLADAPKPFMGYEWTVANPSTPTTNCLCGIRIKSKLFKIDPTQCIEGRISFLETSARLKVAAGFSQTMDLTYDLVTLGTDYHPVHVEQYSYAKSRDMLGGMLKGLEYESNVQFNDRGVSKDPLRNIMMGTGSIINDNNQQYVKMSMTINHAKQTQGFSHRNTTEFITYDTYAPLGAHRNVWNELVRLASAAGAPINTPVA